MIFNPLNSRTASLATSNVFLFSFFLIFFVFHIIKTFIGLQLPLPLHSPSPTRTHSTVQTLFIDEEIHHRTFNLSKCFSCNTSVYCEYYVHRSTCSANDTKIQRYKDQHSTCVGPRPESGIPEQRTRWAKNRECLVLV